MIGVIGEDGSGKSALLRLASGMVQPVSGEVRATEPRRFIAIGDPLNLGPVSVLALDHALARSDALVRARCLMAVDRLRRNGATVLMTSHEADLIRRCSDEVWWLDDGRLRAKGDPQEILESYHRHIAQRLVEWGRSVSQPLAPSLRRGDGRAELIAIEILDAGGAAAMVLESGREMAVRVTVKFAAEVADPVVGIMVRTRIGFEVFGTNTELEKLPLGPVRAGETVRVTFRFNCDLCPRDYTLTAASHDPDGVWHDWMEDAVAFAVTDSRYTAGVARLAARAEMEKVADQ